jgi:hypothetical protein
MVDQEPALAPRAARLATFGSLLPAPSHFSPPYIGLIWRTSLNTRAFPDTLVLAFTTLYENVSCPGRLAAQISQGNTFSAAFDMSHVPHSPGGSGAAYLMKRKESNFEPEDRLELVNEGVAGTISFTSIRPVRATIFGESHALARVLLVGKPNNNDFEWLTAIFIGGGCIVTNGASPDLMSRLGTRS